jgi:hypothetical protein
MGGDAGCRRSAIPRLAAEVHRGDLRLLMMRCHATLGQRRSSTAATLLLEYAEARLLAVAQFFLP